MNTTRRSRIVMTAIGCIVAIFISGGVTPSMGATDVSHASTAGQETALSSLFASSHPVHPLSGANAKTTALSYPPSANTARQTEIVGGVLYVAVPRSRDPAAPVGTTIFALNPATGQKLWTVFILGRALMTAAGSLVYVSWNGDNSGGVEALSATTGATNWQFTLHRRYLGSLPVVAGGVMYVAMYGSGGRTTVYAFNASTGHERTGAMRPQTLAVAWSWLVPSFTSRTIGGLPP